MFKKDQRFTRTNQNGQRIEIIIRRKTTATTVVFDIMPLPYWWEGEGARFGLRMKQQQFAAWLDSLKIA